MENTHSEELRQSRTRVSELEFVNDLFKGRVEQLEADNHRLEIQRREAETQIRFVYEKSQAQENALKREIEDLKREIEGLKDELGGLESTQPHSKRQRLSDDSSTAARSHNSA